MRRCEMTETALPIDRAKVEIPYRTRFWGSDVTCDPRFVDEVLGDGMVLLGLQPLATRPHYYLVRVDSSWHLDGCRACPDECPDQLVEQLEEIYEAIEEEYGECEHIRESNEDLEDGEDPDSDAWPVFDYGCGTSWFTVDPKPFLKGGTE